MLADGFRYVATSPGIWGAGGNGAKFPRDHNNIRVTVMEAI